MSDVILPGASPAVRAPPARGRGDEAGPHLARVRTVPQDLHTEARERQVRCKLSCCSTYDRRTYKQSLYQRRNNRSVKDHSLQTKNNNRYSREAT